MKKSTVVSRKRQSRQRKKQLKQRKRSLRYWLARIAERRRRALAALANAPKKLPHPDQVDPDVEDAGRLPELGKQSWDAATTMDLDSRKSSLYFGADPKQPRVLQKASVTTVTFKLPEGEPLTMDYTQPSGLLRPACAREMSVLFTGGPPEFVLVQSITLKPPAARLFLEVLRSAAIKITGASSINLKQRAAPEKPRDLRIPRDRSQHPLLPPADLLARLVLLILRRTPPAAASHPLKPASPGGKKKMTWWEFCGWGDGEAGPFTCTGGWFGAKEISVPVKNPWPYYKKCCVQKSSCLFRHHRQGRSYTNHVKNERHSSHSLGYSPVRVKKSLSKAVGAGRVTQGALGHIAGRNQRSRPPGKISYPIKSSYGSYRTKAKLLGFIPSRVEKPPLSFTAADYWFQEYKDYLAERQRLAEGSSPVLLAAPLVQKMAGQTQEALYNSGQSEGISASLGTNNPLPCRPLH